MYGLFFLTLHSIIRSQLFEQMAEVWIDDMPYVDRVYHLCLEIYLCREEKVYVMEEELFSKLIFLMRSRETCINYTRVRHSYYNPQLVQHRTRMSEAD